MKSLIRLITIFLFVTIRSNYGRIANISVDSISTEETKEEVINHLSENVFDDKPQEWVRVVNDMNCAENEIEKHNELLLASDLIKNGGDKLSEQSYADEETILVLGNAGSGKTTFSQFMAGDNKKLMSMEVGNDTGEYVIVDGFKIGVSPIDSQTFYPEQVKNGSDVSFTDTPGFSDTRSPRYELAVSYVMKKYMENIKRVKIVLLITYNSVQYGVYKDDFMNLLRRINSFIKDIDKLKASLILIANKVPNTYKVTKSGVKLVPDQNIIRSIVNFIHKVKESALQKIATENNSDEKKFLENAVKIIESLEETDEDGNSKKINIFRRPSEHGSLEMMTLLQKQKESIKIMINKVRFSESTRNSVGYSLSDKAKIYLDCLLQFINEKIDSISANIFQLISNHYHLKIKNYNDIYNLKSQLYYGLTTLESLKKELEGSRNLTNFLSLTEKFISHENIDLVKIDKHNFTDIYEYINNFQQFVTNDYNPFSPEIWSDHLKPVIANVKENIVWYDSLTEIFEKLSSYEIQKIKSGFYNATNLNNFIYPFKLIYTDSNQNVNINYFNGKALSEKRRKEFDEILTMTFKESYIITCDYTGKFIMRSNFIKISSLVNGLLENYCKEHPIKFITLIAYTVFVDDNIDRLDLKGINIMIVAIKWEVIGQRKILIEGKPPRYHEKSKATDGKNLGDNGENGMPGFPGNNGGIFLGIGLKFKNIMSLLVNVNGGAGSPGQHGGDGAKGKTGKHGYEMFNTEPSLNNYTLFWDYGYERFPSLTSLSSIPYSKLNDHQCEGSIKMYNQDGDCGELGGKGGDGGVGGYGGHAGKIMLVSAINETIEISKKNSTGNPGTPGKGGIGGLPGNKGFSSTCYHLYYTNTVLYQPTTSTYWVCTNNTEVTTICAESNFNSLDGESNIVSTGIERPDDFNNHNFLHDHKRFESAINYNWKNKFLRRDVIKLEDPIFIEYIYEIFNN